MKKIIWLLIAVLLIGGAVVLVKKKRQAMADIPPMKLYHQVVEVMTPTIDDIVLTLPALSEVKKRPGRRAFFQTFCADYQYGKKWRHREERPGGRNS